MHKKFINNLFKTSLLTGCLLVFSISIFSLVPVLNVSAAEAPPESVQLINPIGGTANDPKGKVEIEEIVGTAIKTVTQIMGSLALLVFVYGGFLWLTSAGNSEHVKKGTSAMLWAAIGIFIIFSSYAIITLIFKGLSGA